MTVQIALLQRFESALPLLRNWITDTVAAHEGTAIPVSELGFANLCNHFPADLLSRAKAVSTPRVPVPPLTQMGVPELSSFEQMPLAGITYKDTFFVHQSQRTESLHFHELVHVIQWDRLGVANFLRAYGIGFVQFGYKNSPLEQMAYILQRNFDNGVVPSDLIAVIYERTDQFWNQVAPLFQQAGINVDDVKP